MAKHYERRKTRRQVAVVGEGPTEWHFTNDLNHTESIKVAVKPSLPKGSNFRDIFKKAQGLLKLGYDKVYCLIDLDVCCKTEENYATYQRIKKSVTSKGSIAVYETMPCIEYWFLLHFKGYSTRIFSDCDEVIKELKNYIANYEKSNDYMKKIRIYNHLISKGDLRQARDSAHRLQLERARSGNRMFPFSDIHEFIDDILMEK